MRVKTSPPVYTALEHEAMEPDKDTFEIRTFYPEVKKRGYFPYPGGRTQAAFPAISFERNT
ncbi:hypothetical protein DF107_04150 [Burkholderia stagnalis]|uniref:hypothetical protein n=1 Tax=Burkholderia stagnalis TaxID=1503054 RepID=UPI000F5856BB|nr:hypothetical protein [Burkholderia stagnalis]MDY7807200.1 hypothetical protein [Burkholderia stagnalis]RQP98077.1 hypothetical protein DF164_31785 [Burkholderia stagnalis]RQQ21557.1 hypothetical protein DF161_02115 [Burkholderia stagnalis]RQQ21638.1 hypothetical protein DF163_32015 [Burkholderia stagnalis]RQQ23280.1 hypothetical protein DF149_31060 [Burkholderia stagnalis]